MDDSAAERIHELLMDVVRLTGVLQPDHAAPGHSLTLSQAFAVHELDADTPLSQQDLAARLRLDKSSVSRLAAELERKGLLLRERDPDNRRVYRLRLTDAGRALRARMATTFHQRYEDTVSAMTRAERQALITGLAALVRVVREGQVPGAAQLPPDTTRVSPDRASGGRRER